MPKEAIGGAVLAALAKRIRTQARVDAIRAQVQALLAECASPSDRPQEIRRRLAQVQERRRNWEKAIDKGLNLDAAVANLKRLDGENESLERELAVARTRKTLQVDVRAASREILAGLDRLQEVLEKGSVAEVKAVLRAYIGRVEYDHETNRARVGFLRLPTRALISRAAPESARISVVAGAGFAARRLRRRTCGPSAPPPNRFSSCPARLLWSTWKRKGPPTRAAHQVLGSGGRIRCAAPAASNLRAVGFAAGQVLILPRALLKTPRAADEGGPSSPW